MSSRRHCAPRATHRLEEKETQRTKTAGSTTKAPHLVYHTSTVRFTALALGFTHVLSTSLALLLSHRTTHAVLLQPDNANSSSSSNSSSPSSPPSSSASSSAAINAPYPTCTLPLYPADNSPTWFADRARRGEDLSSSLGRGTARNRPRSGDASVPYRMFWTFSEPCWKEKKDGIGGGATPFAAAADDDDEKRLSRCRGKARRCGCEGRLWEDPIDTRRVCALAPRLVGARVVVGCCPSLGAWATGVVGPFLLGFRLGFGRFGVGMGYYLGIR